MLIFCSDIIAMWYNRQQFHWTESYTESRLFLSKETCNILNIMFIIVGLFNMVRTHTEPKWLQTILSGQIIHWK